MKTGVGGLWAVKKSWGHREVEVRVLTLSRGSLADQYTQSHTADRLNHWGLL